MRHPELADRPLAVQQWEGLIAVVRLGVWNRPALPLDPIDLTNPVNPISSSVLLHQDYRCKRAGVGRFTSIAEAMKILPDLACVHVDVRTCLQAAPSNPPSRPRCSLWQLAFRW
jgi:hypothetical protein